VFDARPQRRVRLQSSGLELTDAARQGSGPHLPHPGFDTSAKHAVFGETICLQCTFCAYHSISVFETF